MLVEVADGSLEIDRSEKMAAYAIGDIPVYWIINLIDRQVEVYSDPLAGPIPVEPGLQARPDRAARDRRRGGRPDRRGRPAALTGGARSDRSRPIAARNLR